MRIYIAGALSSKEKADRNPSQVIVDYISNLNKMVQAASIVRRKGHYPYVPGLDLLLGLIVGDWEEWDYRDLGMSFLEVCDALVVISSSWGVEKEILRARALGITIYESLGQVPNV